MQYICTGQLEKVRIQHDGSGIGPGWFLDKVVVIQSEKNESTEFPWYNWLEKEQGNKMVSVDLLPRNRSLFKQ